MAFAFIVDKVVGEELSEPILEAKLDVILEVKLVVKGFTAENTLFCALKKQNKTNITEGVCLVPSAINQL